jgi:2-keto-4-pentenoate hydratase
MPPLARQAEAFDGLSCSAETDVDRGSARQQSAFVEGVVGRDGPHDEQLPPETLQRLADRLLRAEIERSPIPPITAEWPDLRLPDAYAIQRLNLEHRVADGAVPIGHKAGLTSRVVQEFFGLAEPIFGGLLSDMAVEDRAELAHDSLIAPRAEAEIAVVLGRELRGPGVTTTQALAALDGVLAAIEIGDSRITDWRGQGADTVADNASSGRFVLGGRLLPARGLDLRLLGVLFSRNGKPIESGAGAAALGHPARVVARLANRLADAGPGLDAGDIVLCGALHRMVPVRAGDVLRADFAHLGTVSVRVTGSTEGAQ